MVSGGLRHLAVTMVVLLLVLGMYVTGRILGQATTPRPAPQSAAPSEPAPHGAPDGESRFHDRVVPPVVTSPSAAPLPPTEVGPLGTIRTIGATYAALTFDDGPDPRWTPQVLDLLLQHGVRATFCVLGKNAAAYPELIQQIAADGHTLCNHSWDHALDLGERSKAAIEADLLRTNAAIRAAVPDAEIAYYRQPGGMWTSRVVEVASALGMASLHWTVDPQDWREPRAREISRLVLTHTFPGAIVLLHDGGGDRRNTVQALADILDTPSIGFDALPGEPALL